MSWEKIDHVVVLMMENLSFDRVLGWMRPEEHDVDGAVPGRACRAEDGFPGDRWVPTGPGASLVPPGAPHLAGSMFDQLHGDGPATNRGFARQADRYARRRARLDPADHVRRVQDVMKWYRPEDLPVTRDLALHFAVADRWYCPIASSTWPNRYFLHYGTSPTGALHLPQLSPRRPTIFQRLNDVGLRWRIYVDGPANVFACGAIRHEARRARAWARKQGASREDSAHIRPFSRFLCDFAPDPSGERPLPTYTFIEPRHWGKNKNNDHTGTHVHRGQRLIATIYNALRADPERWARTLFILTYDEHGGYHDHRGPPAAPHPDTGIFGEAPDKGSMAWYGGRVPALLISPWIRPGAYHSVCDHTSILAFLARRFGLEPLTHRDRLADDLTAAFQQTLRPTPERMVLPPDPGEVEGAWPGETTALELDLYRVMASIFGADGEREIATLQERALVDLGEQRAWALLDAERDLTYRA